MQNQQERHPTITTPAKRSSKATTPSPSSRNCTQQQQQEIVVSCAKLEAILFHNFAHVFEHIDDDVEVYLEGLSNILELVLSNNSIKTISATITKVWYQSLIKSNSDHQVCGLYKILVYFFNYTQSKHLEFHNCLINGFKPGFYGITKQFINQIGGDRFDGFHSDYMHVYMILERRSPMPPRNTVQLKQTPVMVKNEPTKSMMKDELNKSTKHNTTHQTVHRSEPSSRINTKNEKVPSSSQKDQQQPSHEKLEKIPRLKNVESEKIPASSNKAQQSKPQPPSSTAQQTKQEKVISTPKVKPEKVATTKTAPSKSERLNTSGSSSNNTTPLSPSKPKIKAATPMKNKPTIATSSSKPVAVGNQPVNNNRATPNKATQIQSTTNSDESSPSTKKSRERKWRKEHNDELVEYFSKHPDLANNSFFESDKLMQQFIKSHEFSIPLTIPTLAKRKYKYDQFFSAIKQVATQTLIKAEKDNSTNKRKDPPSSTSSNGTAKRHKM